MPVSLMSPVPAGALPVAPVPTLVHVGLSSVGGKSSVTLTPVALLGPALLTVMVYVTCWPGTTSVTPLVLVIARSATGVRVLVSVAVLLPGVGSVTPGGGPTVAVLARVPVADGPIWTVKVNVTVAPAGRSTVVASAPVPPLGPLT